MAAAAAALALAVSVAMISVQPMPAAEPGPAEGGQLQGIALYDSLFPDADVPDALKMKVIDSMLNAPHVELSVPEGQEELANRAVELMMIIEATTDEELREQKQRELDEMTVPMLEAGLVIADKYRQDPDKWDALLEEYSDYRTP